MASLVPPNTPMDPQHSSRLSLRQRFYLLEVLVGLAITAHHFFANMWKHTLHTVFREGRSRPVTVDTRTPATRLGCGAPHRLVRREDGSPRWRA
jgi:hypothetical protein